MTRSRQDEQGDERAEFHLSPDAKKVFTGLVLGMFVASISQTIVGPAMPRIVAELGGMDHYSWIATAAMLASAIVVPIVGKLSDMYGRRWFYIGGLCIFMAGSLMAGFASSFWLLVAARAVQGVGMGALQPLSQTIIGDIIPARNRGKYQGIMGAIFGFSSVLGPLFGGWVTDSIGWRWLFFLPLPIGLIALYVIIRFLRIPVAKSTTKFDMAGAVTLSISLVLILLATTWGGNTYAWSSPVIISMYAVGAAFLAAFIWAEMRATNPLLPLRMFKNSVFTFSVLATFALSVAMFGMIIYVPVYAQIVLEASATNSGIILMPLNIAMIVTSVTVGFLISRWGKYKAFMVVGLAIMLGANFGLATIGVETSQLTLSLILVTFGFGLGMAMQVYTLVVQNDAKQSEMGIATSAVQFFRNLGSTVGTAVLGTVMSASLTENIMAHLPAEAAEQFLSSGQEIDAGSVLDTSKVDQLPPAVELAVRSGMADSMHAVFVTAIPFIVLALVFTLFIKQKPLRTTVYDVNEILEEAPPQGDVRTTTYADYEQVEAQEDGLAVDEDGDQSEDPGDTHSRG